MVGRGTDAGSLLPDLLRRFPDAELRGGQPQHAGWLAAWVRGERRDLAPIDLRGINRFDAEVYRATRAVGWGERATYGDLAMAAGHPRAARAVGTAMSRCPFFPAVPCHRVVRAADGWSGWGPSGNALKHELLAREAGSASSR
jgi:O-6-methylguanine DNA methyltransferase